MSGYSQKYITTAKKLGGTVSTTARTVSFKKTVKIKTRAAALDAVFLLIAYDDWSPDQDELLEGLRKFIKKLPVTEAGQ